MSSPTVFRNVVESMLRPDIVHLDDNLYAAKFVLVKIIPAKFMLDEARRAGKISKGSHIVETTSGTFALALAIICKLEGYRLTIVSDPAIDSYLQTRLEYLGANVILVKEPAAVGGYQRTRLEKLASVLRANPEAYWPRQYHNPQNPTSYHGLAKYLSEALGRIDCLIGTVGSGGTLCGTGRSLRDQIPDLRVVGIDSYGSVLFGAPDRRRLLRGAGSSIMFGNVDHSVFDEVHWVSGAEAFLAARTLFTERALFMGGTSGASYFVARWWARRHSDKKVVAIFPDEGYRYQHTVYDKAWLKRNEVDLDVLPEEPCLVQHPREIREEWSMFLWGRRTYENVIGCPPPEFGIPASML